MIRMTKKNTRYVELIGTMKPDDVLPGSIELLNGLRASGIKCAIASASKNTPKVLSVTALNKYIDGVADGNQAKKSKPDPEVFLLAAKNCGCSPEACIGIEDAVAGIEAIKNAGMVSIGIGSAAPIADYAIEGVHELTADILKKMYAEKRPS